MLPRMSAALHKQVSRDSYVKCADVRVVRLPPFLPCVTVNIDRLLHKKALQALANLSIIQAHTAHLTGLCMRTGSVWRPTAGWPALAFATLTSVYVQVSNIQSSGHEALALPQLKDCDCTLGPLASDCCLCAGDVWRSPQSGG